MKRGMKAVAVVFLGSVIGGCVLPPYENDYREVYRPPAGYYYPNYTPVYDFGYYPAYYGYYRPEHVRVFEQERHVHVVQPHNAFHHHEVGFHH